MSEFFPHPFMLRGNLHTHTTRSDGRRTPEEVIQGYADLGYDFLALTDHRLYGALPDQPNMIMLPGVEMDFYDENHGTDHHIVLVARDQPAYPDGTRVEPEPFASLETVQKLIDEMRGAHFVSYAHPVWSNCFPEDVLPLRNLDSVEVFNYGCELEDHTARCEWWVDALARRKMPRVCVMAVDDGHSRLNDWGGGWIVVNAREKTRAAIQEAIAEGRYYASMGPSIEGISWDGKNLTVKSSPARAIHFVSYHHRGRSFFGDGQPLTEATYAPDRSIAYIRIEIEDERGYIAWSHPYTAEMLFGA